ncbi:F-box/FBD/LRR-repeat protein At4g26340-like [Silene latifolia]|uniref:F-box/FBD/LRR-repeat protein At4g26340-like n=1 Tax=Silene latifolia TaxID=37657 RepID=UPI003D776DB0
MKPQKHKCSSEYYADVGRDRLSEMPDDVIVHILSCMPTIVAVRTMLIRRFGNLWTLAHTLDFKVPEFLDIMAAGSTWSNDVGRFNIFVHNVLKRHKRPFINKFHLLLGWLYEHRREEAGDDIKMWLKFAFDKQAKDIYFCDVGYHFADSSDFPNFTSQSLVTLELWSCSVFPEFQVNLGSLKKLILCHTYMCEEALQQFICGCPSLQELRIVEPTINKLRFSAPNIRKLSLVLIEHVFDDPWSLDFPKLKSLDLETNWIPDVIDVSSIRDVYLKRLYFNLRDENEHRRLNIFWEKFSRSEVFQLSLDASEQFLHSINDLNLLQIRWKRVVLGLRIFCQSCLLGFYHLMRISKDLEELDIYTRTTLAYTSVCNTPNLFSGQAFRASADLPPVELSHPCVMPKLKIVTLHGYAKPWEHQLQLVEFLLKSATVLEKLVIYPNKHHKMDFVMHVSSFQRSSPSARVLFL